MTDWHARIADLVDENFAAEVAFLRELVRLPTDTPPGDNAAHAQYTAELLEAMGYQAERHAVPAPLRGTVELHFTYDEEYGAATPTLNVGVIAGGINTNVVPDKVTLRLDRRISAKEGAAEVEARLAQVMRQAVQGKPASRSKSGGCCLPRRCGRARHRHDWLRPCKGTPARCLRKLLALALVRSIRMRALYGEAGLPVVLYGAGPRTLSQANAKRADENILLADLRRATIVIARVLLDLLGADTGRARQA
jgi:succinyl-diaminopimelate desuccinylase